MTKDELIRLAVECHLVTTGNRDGVYMDALERFAHAVAQAERDADKDLLQQARDLIAYLPIKHPQQSKERQELLAAINERLR